MSNHVHLVGKCEEVVRLSACMNIVNSMFARTINKRLGRCGQVIMDRYKSTVIGDNIELLRVSRYVELNPYKAGIVIHPKNYQWSSYNHYAYGIADELLVEDPCFIDMGTTDEERRSNYISIIMESIDTREAKKRIKYWSINYLGPETWVNEKELKLKEVARIKRMNNRKNKIKISKKDVIEVT